MSRNGIQPLSKIYIPILPTHLYAAAATHISPIFRRHLEESTDHGIQPRHQYSASSRRREAHQSIHILRCSFISLQRPGMARQVPRAMDPPGNDNRCPAGQLRPECRTSTTTGHIRGCINTYRCVSVLPSSNLSLTSVIAIGLLIMMYPILCKVKFETLHLAFRHRSLWIQIGFSIVMNWLVAPFVMVSPAAHVVKNLQSLIGFLVTVEPILGFSS